MIKTLAVVGVQWGDEGKGRVVYHLGKYFDYIVRYQGGNNAGHTVIYKGKPFVLHLVPCGILLKGKKCVIGNGVVLSPQALYEEVKTLERMGINVSNRLYISYNAHVILTYHSLLDRIFEEENIRVGTTKKGIGPCYADKVKRIGVRVCDFIEKDTFFALFDKNLKEKSHFINAYQRSKIYKEVRENYEKLKRFIEKFAVDTTVLLNEALEKNKRILFEGAQGTLLDADFGTYPYVTSSNPSAGGVSIGTGIGPTKIDYVLGVAKAYTTRVGEGPFPTEIKDEHLQNHLRETGLEYGATTGRPRRCGWFDAVAARYAIMLNGTNSIALTKLDCLMNLSPLKICVAYSYNGKEITSFPQSRKIQNRVRPKYIELEGYSTIYEGGRLSKNLMNYILKIEELVNCKIRLFAYGRENFKISFLDNQLYKELIEKTGKKIQKAL